MTGILIKLSDYNKAGGKREMQPAFIRENGGVRHGKKA
jgi:hypothetical protein